MTTLLWLRFLLLGGIAVVVVFLVWAEIKEEG
jgi:hypothetical protein